MTLRARMLVGIAVVVAVLIAANASTYVSLRARLLDRLDAQLATSGPSLLEVARPLVDKVPKEPELRRLRELAPTGSVVEVRSADGAVVTTVGHDGALVVDGATAETPAPATVRIDGSRWRLLALAVTGPAPPPAKGAAPGTAPAATSGRLLVAVPLAPIDATLRTLLWIEAGSTLAVLVVLGVVVLVVVRRGLRPLEGIARRAATITAGDLEQRLPVHRAGAEVNELTLALNTMLEELQRSFGDLRASEERLRRFVSDASHELRTPLTAIRGYAELYRAGDLRGPDDVTLAMRRIDDASARMTVMVDELLLLARLDQGRPLERADVDLAAVVGDAVLDAVAVEPSRPVSVTGEPSVHVLGDRHRLFQVVTNLLANVRSHTPADTAVAVDVRHDGAHAVLEVHDDGPGMPPAVAARVFDRFYRADQARTRDDAGSGLGLSIVDAVVRAHGGTVTLRTAPGHGSTFTIRLPAGTDDAILRPPPAGLQVHTRFEAHR